VNKGGNVSLVAGSDRPKTSAAEGWISSSGPYAPEFFYRRCKCRSGTQVWSRISEVLWGASDARIASSTGEPGPTDRASLEIITGRIEGDAEQSKVFAVVRDQDGHAKQHVQAITTKNASCSESSLSFWIPAPELPPVRSVSEGSSLAHSCGLENKIRKIGGLNSAERLWRP
jgi:hypothetical protein